jgi:hypothetical protein
MAFMSHYDRLIANLTEPLIEKEMKGGWFKRPKTREQAINHLGADRFGDYWRIVNFRGTRSKRKVEKLLALCNTPSSSVIHLDEEAANILEDFFEPTATMLHG